jgi:hypothetical protein
LKRLVDGLLPYKEHVKCKSQYLAKERLIGVERQYERVEGSAQEEGQEKEKYAATRKPLPGKLWQKNKNCRTKVVIAVMIRIVMTSTAAGKRCVIHKIPGLGPKTTIRKRFPEETLVCAIVSILVSLYPCVAGLDEIWIAGLQGKRVHKQVQKDDISLLSIRIGLCILCEAVLLNEAIELSM